MTAGPSMPPAWPGQPRCRVCGGPMDRITAASRNNVCRMPECERQRTREAGDQVIQRNWDGFRDRTRTRVIESADMLAAAAATLEGDPDKVAMIVVPRLDRPLIRRDDADREAFSEHLDTIIDAAFAGDLAQEDMNERDRLEAPSPGFANAACATCQGFCCRDGGSHFAYLNADTIRSYRRQNQGVTARRVREAYLSRLPETSVEGSCYFHGSQGCTLERGLRADICNRHFCTALVYLFNDPAIDRDGPFVMLAVDDEAVPAISTYSPRTGWQLQEPVADAVELTEDERDTLAQRIVGRMPEKPPLGGPRGNDPPRRVCRWCGSPIGINQAATTGSCGEARCEQQRISEIYRTNPAAGG